MAALTNLTYSLQPAYFNPSQILIVFFASLPSHRIIVGYK